jgi:hypothetical protein
MKRHQHILYLVVLIGVGLVSGAPLYFGSWASQVAACRSLQRPGVFLAYCEQPLYASYEHEAYAFGAEPEAVQAMKRARVVVLGDSREQFAFSTPQLDAFFQARGTPYHLLGFGYGESDVFPAYLFRRYRLAPAVVVINADPFFLHELSPAAHQMFDRGAQTWVDMALKKAFGVLRAFVCSDIGRCTETLESTYRDRRTGQWIWHGVLYPPDRKVTTITDEKSLPWSAGDVPPWRREAEAFLAKIPVRRSCIILTGVPNPQVDAEGMAAAIGKAVGLPVVAPHISGLSTVDGSHLNAPSAARWSAAFLAAAAPTIDACLASAPGSKAPSP